MDSLVSLAGKAAEYTVDPVAHQLSYLFKHKNKFQNLKIKVEELKAAGPRMQQSVDVANRNGEEIFADVQMWLKKVNEKISEQAESQLREDEEKAMKRCFAGFCPDFKSRYQLSKKAEKEANAIAQLLNQKGSFEQVSYPPLISTIRAVKEYENFRSRKGAFDGVIAALEDDNVNIIGVYGMGGVGKTTLVKEAARQAKEKKLFDEVLLVAITQTANMANVQNEIAEKLGLKIEETSMDVRAARLRDRLKKETKVLIVLDDLWVTLDLEALGIPSRDEHKGCRILMTSRRLDVLESMSSWRNLSIETLKEDEAWDLFKNMAGQIVESPDLQSTAVEVAKRCAGLPIAIATTAKALKHKHNLFQWKDALQQLSKPSERNFKGIPADAYSAIELSYKFLEVEESQPIFLLCSIMARDAAIEDLLRYAMGLGLFHDVNTVEETRDKVLTLVSNLKASCLLLDGSDPARFEMHDVVRDVALSIASRDHHWFALGSDDVFKAWPDKATMKNCKLISLQHAELSDELLDHELECPNLTFFSMNGKGSSLKIPENFFKGMQRLKVLNLSQMDLSSLPSSIGSLKTLSTLCLSGSKVKDAAMIGELKKLEILDLRESEIAVPEEIGQLRRLKLLDLSGCLCLQVISPNTMLSRLSRLEELYLYYRFDRWEVEGGIENNERSNASLVELQHLSHLTTLEVHVPNVQAIPKENFFFGKLERYKISVGYEKWGRWFDRDMETSRMLKFKMNESIYFVQGVETLLRKVESLILDGVKDVGKMFYDQSSEGLPHLKHLVIRNVSDIKVVVNSMMLLPHLESLNLHGLINLETICEHGQLKNESFGRLKVIKVENCKMLKNLSSFSLAQALCHQLEKIEVSQCENMTGLFLEENYISGDDNILEFTQLRSLRLKNLSRLNGLWYSEKTEIFATWLFDQKVLFPVMKKLELDSVSGIEKIWHDNHFLSIKSFGVQSLTSLEVRKCHKLKYVFTSSMVKFFVSLKTLQICNCDEIEDIIEGILGGGGEEERISSSIISVFPKVDVLILEGLPKLKRFCCGINIPPSQYISNEKVIFPVLENLHIEGMENLEKLWPNQLAEHSFSKLTSIDLDGCPKLLNVFPSSMLTRLQKLDYLSIQNCESVEEIIYESESELQEGGSSSAIQSDVITTLEFPCLTCLRLLKLPNLKSMYRKMVAINWPSLKMIQVSECEKVGTLFGCGEILLSGKSSSEDAAGNPIQHPLFWVNEFTFPNLNHLTLGWNAGMKDIWNCEGQQLLSQYLSSLKVVLFHKYPEEVTKSTSYLLSLPTLQTLQLDCCSFKELISQSEECGEEKEGFQNLRIFKVEYCPKLRINLVPSSVSFQNLATLEVSRCDGIIKLITHSTAKSLVQLKQMTIYGCDAIEEIIEGGDDNDGDDDDDEINFPKLNNLTLGDLPKLESFSSSGNYAFGFPYLQTLIVYRCPKMKMFSQRDSYTPMLHQVRIDLWGKEERWEGSLNSTIQQLFTQQNHMAQESQNFKQLQSNPSTSNT